MDLYDCVLLVDWFSWTNFTVLSNNYKNDAPDLSY